MELFKSPLDDSGIQTIPIHPLTGEPIRPIGRRSDGRPIWPIMGGAPDDEDDDDADDSGDSDEDEDEGDSGADDSESKDKSKSKDKDKDEDDEDSEETVSKARFDKVKERLRAQDKHLSKVQEELKALKDKDKPDTDKVNERVTELTTKVEEQTTLIAQLRMDNAFLSANTHNWHKPEVAMKVARAEGYLEDVADDDGEVDTKALKKALDKLAKEHSYLVKSGSKSDDEDEDKGKKSGPSGESGPGRAQSKDRKRRQAELSRRMPALTKR